MASGKILHISDLHFGRKFQANKWSDLLKYCANLSPDLVVITGDVVNSPWRYRLSKAKCGIADLKKSLEAHSKKKVEVIFVPGNHDTRFTGLIPVSYLNNFLLLLGILILGAQLWQIFVTRNNLYDGWINSVLVIFFIFGVLRLTVTTNLKKALDGFYLDEPKEFPGLHIGILPFDSASLARFGAHGRFPDGSMNTVRVARRALPNNPDGETEPDDLLWIAAVHHHVLPLPFDSDHEYTMIMENAGTMLDQLAQFDVPLILHGHKHHQHFSRMLVMDKKSQSKEISVLSAGTPTESRNPGRYGHSFNLIEVSPNLEATIYIYGADATALFKIKETISLSSADVYARRSFDRHKRDSAIFCKKMSCSTVIDEYGNARFIREFAGVHTKEAICAIPHIFQIGSTCGEVIDIFAQSHGSNLPNVTCQSTYPSTHSGKCELILSEELTPRSPEIGFHVGFEVANAIAFNSVQFKNMHSDKKDNIEHVTHTIPPKFAVKELFLELRFPVGFRIPKKLRLRAGVPMTNAKLEWAELTDCVDLINTSSAIFAKIKSPIPGCQYQFSWEVERISSPPTTNARFYEWFISKNARDQPLELQKLIEDIQQLALNKLVAEYDKFPEGYFDEKISVILYGYFREEGKLKNIAAIGFSSKILGRDEHRYGLGLAGQAYKSGRVAIYDRNSASSIKNAEAHLQRWNANAGAALDSSAQSESTGLSNSFGNSSIAFPIYLFEGAGNVAPGAEPYAVVQVLCQNMSGRLKLSDTPTDRSTTTFQHTVDKMLQEVATQATMTKK